MKTMLSRVSCSVLVLGIAWYANSALAVAPKSIEDAKLPADYLTKVTPHTAAVGPRGQAGLKLLTRVRGGVPGIDSLTNFTDQFTTSGFDSDGNPQSVWPYSMVGRSPDLGVPTVISAPIIPVVLDLLGPDGRIATFRGQPLTFDPREFVQ